jgi:hypothetical protein
MNNLLPIEQYSTHKPLRSSAMSFVFYMALLPSFLINAALAQSSERTWEPMQSESLIKLPANLIEKRIQQDFDLSPLAGELVSLENEMAAKGTKIQALQALLADKAENEMIEERVSLVQLKSSYLDNMQSSQSLRQQALDKKQSLYEEILQKLLREEGKSGNIDYQQLKQSQATARARMEKVIAQVDDTLLGQGVNERSPYADEFAANLNKIELLKKAISNHQAAMAPTIDGVAVSGQEYVRQLLMQAASDQSLLDQESLMISYMAKLVALDAQSIEFTIAYEETEDGAVINNFTKPAQATDLFL